MSYLRGPLTRTQIKSLMDPLKSQTPSPAAAPAPKPVSPGSAQKPLL